MTVWCVAAILIVGIVLGSLASLASCIAVWFFCVRPKSIKIKPENQYHDEENPSPESIDNAHKLPNHKDMSAFAYTAEQQQREPHCDEGNPSLKSTDTANKLPNKDTNAPSKVSHNLCLQTNVSLLPTPCLSKCVIRNAAL